MLKWLARLFRMNTNGNGAKPTEQDLGEVTKKNVDQHSRKIRKNLKVVNDTLDGLLIDTGKVLSLND